MLKGIYEAQLQNILLSKVLALDETPIKSGREKKGKLKQGYFWPLYGDDDEICFTFSQSRGTQHLFKTLGEFNGTLLSDGYCAYARYVEKSQNATLAQCWVHTRRYFERAQNDEPEASALALEYIGRLYEVERSIKEKALSGEKKLKHRQEYCAAVVESFFAWAHEQTQRIDLLPSSPLAQAVQYALNREHELKVFLSDPQVALDTNHVERALRPIPMGKKNWLFCWAELGAELVGIIQSLIATCRVHDINPYDYLVDVLQRVDQHPASAVHELTPRLWKQKFADKPMRSDLYHSTQIRNQGAVEFNNGLE